MKKILSIVLACMMVVGACVMAACTGTPPVEESLAKGDAFLVKANNTKFMSLQRNIVSTASFEENGISPLAESAYTLTATVTPEAAANHGVDWVLNWKNPSSSWASGKNATDYVSMDISSDTKTATVSCMQPFGEQLIVTASSQDNPDAKATCTLDYAQKVLAVDLNFGDVDINLGGTTTVKYEVSATKNGMGGTVTANVTLSDVYTIAENFAKSVTLETILDDTVASGYRSIALNGKVISDTVAMSNNGVNFYGKDIYYDYNHDINEWRIQERNGDILFKNLTTAQIISYFQNITEPNMYDVKFTLTVAHSSYTYTSRVVCGGYVNSTPVNALTLDGFGYVF